MEIYFDESFGDVNNNLRSGQETPAFVTLTDSKEESQRKERRKTFESYLWDEKKLTIEEWRHMDEKPVSSKFSLRNIKTEFQKIIKKQISASNRDISVRSKNTKAINPKGIEKINTKRSVKDKFEDKRVGKDRKYFKRKSSDYGITGFRVITSAKDIFNSNSNTKWSKAKTKSDQDIPSLSENVYKKSKTINLIDFDLKELGLENIVTSNITPRKQRFFSPKGKLSSLSSFISEKLPRQFSSLQDNQPIKKRESSYKILSDRTCGRETTNTQQKPAKRDNINLINF